MNSETKGEGHVENQLAALTKDLAKSSGVGESDVRRILDSLGAFRLPKLPAPTVSKPVDVQSLAQAFQAALVVVVQ